MKLICNQMRNYKNNNSIKVYIQISISISIYIYLYTEDWYFTSGCVAVHPIECTLKISVNLYLVESYFHPRLSYTHNTQINLQNFFPNIQICHQVWIHTPLQAQTLITAFHYRHLPPPTSQAIHFTHFVWPQLPLAERFFTRVQIVDKKVLHREKGGERKGKKGYESKGEEIEFTVQTSGEFQCPLRHSGALFSPRRLSTEKSSSHSREGLFWQVLTHTENPQ